MANGQDSGCAARCSSTRSAAMIDWLETLLRISIGAFLLTAALAKLRLGPDAFAAAIEGYRIVPRSLGPLAARVLPTSSWAAPLLASAVVAAATVFLLAHGWSVLATRTQVISTGGER